MRKGALVVAALLCTAIGGCGSEGGDVASGDVPTTPPSEFDRATDGDAELDCSQWSSGTHDVIRPDSVEEAQAAGFPSSPEEAANNIATAPLYVGRLDNVELSEGTPVELSGATNAIRFLAVRPDGHVVGNITVQELMPDVWSGAYVSICSPGG